MVAFQRAGSPFLPVLHPVEARALGNLGPIFAFVRFHSRRPGDKNIEISKSKLCLVSKRSLPLKNGQIARGNNMETYYNTFAKIRLKE